MLYYQFCEVYFDLERKGWILEQVENVAKIDQNDRFWIISRIRLFPVGHPKLVLFYWLGLVLLKNAAIVHKRNRLRFLS